jgi:hypothetical protein
MAKSRNAKEIVWSKDSPSEAMPESPSVYSGEDLARRLHALDYETCISGPIELSPTKAHAEIPELARHEKHGFRMNPAHVCGADRSYVVID